MDLKKHEAEFLSMKMEMPTYQGEAIERQHFNKIALIDADKLKHLVTYNIAKDIENNQYEEGKLTEYIDDRINSMMFMFGADAMIFCFSGKSFNTFRYHQAISKEYKGNRKSSDRYDYEGKVSDMSSVVRYIRERHNTLIYDDLEADDVISFLQWEFREHTFVLSNDKDLKQIPGNHFNEENWSLEEISEEEGYRSLMYQVICGDSTDNIPGLSGYGPVKCKKLLEDVPIKIMHHKILSEFQKKHGIVRGLDLFTESYNLVKLRTGCGDYFRNKYASAFDLIKMIIRTNNYE